MKSTLKHIAFILDGNRRWALQHKEVPKNGYQKGMEVAEDILEYCSELDIPTVTLYAFSSENWKRSEQEKQLLFELLLESFSMRLEKIIQRHTRIKILGHHLQFPESIRQCIREAEEKSKDFSKRTLQVALGYGGRDEIIRAFKRCMRDYEDKQIALEDIDETSFKQYLDTQNTSEPDLLIRTGGEVRLSNFLLYQIAYTELYFTKTPWPNFTRKELDIAIASYHSRKRHYGA